MTGVLQGALDVGTGGALHAGAGWLAMRETAERAGAALGKGGAEKLLPAAIEGALEGLVSNGTVAVVETAGAAHQEPRPAVIQGAPDLRLYRPQRLGHAPGRCAPSDPTSCGEGHRQRWWRPTSGTPVGSRARRGSPERWWWPRNVHVARDALNNAGPEFDEANTRLRLKLDRIPEGASVDATTYASVVQAYGAARAQLDAYIGYEQEPWWCPRWCKRRRSCRSGPGRPRRARGRRWRGSTRWVRRMWRTSS